MTAHWRDSGDIRTPALEIPDAGIPITAPVAVRLLGLVEFQKDISRRRPEAVCSNCCGRSGIWTMRSCHYLELIADQHNDPEQALRLYAPEFAGRLSIRCRLCCGCCLRASRSTVHAWRIDRIARPATCIQTIKPQHAAEILAALLRPYIDLADYPRAVAGLLDRGGEGVSS